MKCCPAPPKIRPKWAPWASRRALLALLGPFWGRFWVPREPQEGLKRRQASSRRPKKPRKTLYCRRILAFRQRAIWSRLGSSKSRLGGAKRAPGAAQEPPRAPQGGPREAQEPPRAAKSGPGGRPGLPGEPRGRPRSGPGARGPRGPPKGAEEASKRPPQHSRRYCRETAMLPKTIPQTDKRSFRTHEGRGHFTRRQLTKTIPQTDKRSFRTHEDRGHFTRGQLTSCI